MRRTSTLLYFYFIALGACLPAPSFSAQFSCDKFFSTEKTEKQLVDLLITVDHLSRDGTIVGDVSPYKAQVTEFFTKKNRRYELGAIAEVEFLAQQSEVNNKVQLVEPDRTDSNNSEHHFYSSADFIINSKYVLELKSINMNSKNDFYKPGATNYKRHRADLLRLARKAAFQVKSSMMTYIGRDPTVDKYQDIDPTELKDLKGIIYLKLTADHFINFSRKSLWKYLKNFSTDFFSKQDRTYINAIIVEIKLADDVQIYSDTRSKSTAEYRDPEIIQELLK